MSCWVAEDRVSHPACCAMVWVGFPVCEGVQSSVQGHILKWSQVSSCASPQMHLVYLAGTLIEVGR